MNHNNKEIAHLKYLGETRAEAINTLEEELKKGSDFLERAEITDSINHRDGGMPNKRLGYVAGICGSREARNEFDLGKDVYKLVYFNCIIKREGNWEYGGGTIHSPSLQDIVDYTPLNPKGAKY
ncbi:MAG: hypothetical protein U9R34_03980 [Nanoarchaeota archaeon]|nr:hypothetical protein [Nanoarchaeota archaeon]